MINFDSKKLWWEFVCTSNFLLIYFQLLLLDGRKRDDGAVQYCGAEMQLQHEELWVGRLMLCFLSALTQIPVIH